MIKETLVDTITSFFSSLGRATVAVVTAPVKLASQVVAAPVQLVSQLLTMERRYERSISPSPSYDYNVQTVQQLTFNIDFITVTAWFPSGSGPGKGPGKDDVVALLGVVVSIGCLVVSGPLMPAFQVAAFAITGYNLSTKTMKMVQRVLDGENVFELSTQNVTEWLDLISTADGFASTCVTKLIVSRMRDGSGKTVLVFLANVLKHKGMHCKTASYSVKVLLGDYMKKLDGMSAEQRSVELAAVVIHFIKLGELYE